MKRRLFSIILKLRGPILIKSSSPSTFGVDAGVARISCGPKAGTPCIPGTLIKGKLREALDQLTKAGVIAKAPTEVWFGKDTERESGNDPARGSLHFGDFIADSNPQNSKVRHGIAIDPNLGSVKGEMLWVIETPFGAGEEVAFTGSVWCYGADNIPEIRRHIRLGLLWLTQIGAERTKGFGRLLDASIELENESFQQASIPDDVVALELSIKPLGPLCISRHKIGGNLFDSKEFIPGNVIAGALAESAKALGLSIDHFDDLVFRHAFPALEGGRRPPAVPFTAVSVGNLLCDVAALKQPHLLQDDKSSWLAPQFPVDWKQDVWEKAEARLGIVHPERELRVRTAIDSEKRTGEKGDPKTGGALFAWEMIHPWTRINGSNEWKPLFWKGRIELAAIPDAAMRKKVAQQLAALLPQLGYVSKTKAACEIALTPISRPFIAEVNEGDSLTLVLRTPALLADGRFQNVACVAKKDGAFNAADMLALYAAVWDEISGDSLALSHHFARQFLAGGNHLALRYQLRNGKVYDPWLLTAAGSVFVFTVKNAAAAKSRLEKWLNAGLPLPGWAKTRYGDDWRKNPYIPQNGFGEITIQESFFDEPQARPINLADPILP